MNNNILPTDYQSFIALSRYAKWLDKEGRRETFSETVDRYMENVVSPKIYDGQENTQGVLERLEVAILEQLTVTTLACTTARTCQ